MKTDWLIDIITNTNLPEVSALSEKERVAIIGHFRDKQSFAEIGGPMLLTAYRVEQIIQGGLKKIVLHINRSNKIIQELQNALHEKERMEEELEALRSRLREYTLVEEQKSRILIDMKVFSTRARKTLEKLRIRSVNDLECLSIKKLSNQRHAGVQTVEEIVNKAKEFGVEIN